jgi:biopolymer transport protein TolR
MADIRRPRKSINQMNVVPYIDVMLVLLVIFMVTAPLINPGQVELPSVGSKLSAPVQPLEVTLRTDQSLWLRDATTGAPLLQRNGLRRVGLLARPPA